MGRKKTYDKSRFHQIMVADDVMGALDVSRKTGESYSDLLRRTFIAYDPATWPKRKCSRCKSEKDLERCSHCDGDYCAECAKTHNL